MSVVLLLNADYSPMKVIGWQRATELVLDQKAIVVESEPGKFVRSEKLALPWPTIIALRRYKTNRGRIKFSAKNVILRDLGRCSYCGFSPKTKDGRIDRMQLTHDHVIPRAQAKHGAVYLYWNKKWVNVTSWENATTACRNCNARKADRTPEQAGMSLQVYPRHPTQADVIRMSLARVRSVPASWAQYLPGIESKVQGAVVDDVDALSEETEVAD